MNRIDYIYEKYIEWSKSSGSLRILREQNLIGFTYQARAKGYKVYFDPKSGLYIAFANYKI